MPRPRGQGRPRGPPRGGCAPTSRPRRAPRGESGVPRVSVAALVLAARAARAQVIAADVGERVGRRVAPTLHPAAFGGGRVLELARTARLKARWHRAGRDRAAASRRDHAGRAAVRGGLPAPGRCRVPAPVGGVSAALARAALPGTALPAAALPGPGRAGTALSGPALSGTPLGSTPLGGATLPGGRRGRTAERRWRHRRPQRARGRTACGHGPGGHGPGRGGSAAERGGRRAGRDLLDDRVLLDLELEVEEVPDRLLLDAVHHGVEHVVALPLVLDQRVALRHRTQADALAEVVHLVQVLAPLAVEHQ